MILWIRRFFSVYLICDAGIILTKEAVFVKYPRGIMIRCILNLLDKVEDDAVIQRVWKILERAYSAQTEKSREC